MQDSAEKVSLQSCMKPSRAGQPINPKKVTFALPPLEPDRYDPASPEASTSYTESPVTATVSQRHTIMTEPRARAARHKGQLNFHPECKFHLTLQTSRPLQQNSLKIKPVYLLTSLFLPQYHLSSTPSAMSPTLYPKPSASSTKSSPTSSSKRATAPHAPQPHAAARRLRSRTSSGQSAAMKLCLAG